MCFMNKLRLEDLEPFLPRPSGEKPAQDPATLARRRVLLSPPEEGETPEDTREKVRLAMQMPRKDTLAQKVA